jgi:hypothetical protein
MQLAYLHTFGSVSDGLPDGKRPGLLYLEKRQRAGGAGRDCSQKGISPMDRRLINLAPTKFALTRPAFATRLLLLGP